MNIETIVTALRILSMILMCISLYYSRRARKKADMAAKAIRECRKNLSYLGELTDDEIENVDEEVSMIKEQGKSGNYKG